MVNLKSNLKFLIVRLVCLIVLALCLSQAAFGQEPVTIDILTVNDFHGMLLEEGKNPGAAKLAGFLKAEKEHNPTGVLILSAGDMFQGTAESNLLYGQSVLDVMNEIGFEAMAIGNHEFDWGLGALNTLEGKAKFPFLSANIFDKNSLASAPFAKPYIIVEKNGIKIGIIGLTTLESAYVVKPSIIADLIFNDLAETVNSLIPVLKNEGAEIIVVLGHIGSAMSGLTSNLEGEAADLAGKVQEIDAIVSGHTHLKVAGNVNGIPLVQAGCWGQAVGKISLVYSKEAKKVIGSKVEVISLQDVEIVPDAKVKNIVEESSRIIEPIKNERIGIAVNELSHSRRECSVLGQWVSDVMRKRAEADIAFQNGGGLRTNIFKGVITAGKIYEVVPFDNTIVTLDMTGEQVMKVLEHGICNERVSMLQYSGINVIWGGSSPEREGIVAVTTLDGRKLDLNKTYKVATIDFLVDGGDGFTMFKEGKNIKDTYLLERDMLIDYIKSVKSIKFKGDERFKLEGRKVKAA